MTHQIRCPMRIQSSIVSCLQWHLIKTVQPKIFKLFSRKLTGRYSTVCIASRVRLIDIQTSIGSYIVSKKPKCLGKRQHSFYVEASSEADEVGTFDHLVEFFCSQFTDIRFFSCSSNVKNTIASWRR